jgi:hypothetical protein
MRFAFFGPTSMSGIGQVTRKYARLLHGDYIEFGEIIGDKEYDVGFAYILPIDSIIQVMKEYQKKCKKMVYYTVCETEPVNDDYIKLFELSDTFYTTSQFSADILAKQFPNGTFKVLKNFAGPPVEIKPIKYSFGNNYVFYHIGNIIDPRKNISALIECFYRAQIPNSLLVLKATCNQKVEVNLPNVVIIQDFMDDGEMEHLHSLCHCYVSLSHSEGAGMGAVEAALRNKHVIVQEYGGTKEYIETPYVVPCSVVPVGLDDFLFKKEHMWGEPDKTRCIEFMKDAYEHRNDCVTHQHTYTEMSLIPKILRQSMA